MKTPQPSVRPKSRERILRETIFGVVMLLLGAALLLVPMLLLEQEPNKWLIVAGGSCLTVAAFSLNKKMMIELLHEARDALPFLKDNPDGGS